MLLAAMLVVLFITIVGSIMLIGWRHRPPLEIPPKVWPIVDVPQEVRALRLRLLVVGQTGLWGGLIGSALLRERGLRIPANVVLLAAISIYVGAIVARIVLSLRSTSRTRKPRSGSEPQRS